MLDRMTEDSCDAFVANIFDSDVIKMCTYVIKILAQLISKSWTCFTFLFFLLSLHLQLHIGEFIDGSGLK